MNTFTTDEYQARFDKVLDELNNNGAFLASVDRDLEQAAFYLSQPLPAIDRDVLVHLALRAVARDRVQQAERAET